MSSYDESESHMELSDAASSTKAFSNRKSKAQKNIEELCNHIRSTDFILAQQPTDENCTLGFSALFLRVLKADSTDEIATLLEEQPTFTRQFYTECIGPVLLRDVDDEAVRESCSKILWQKTLGEGTKLNRTNAERMAWTRLRQKHESVLSAEIAEAIYTEAQSWMNAKDNRRRLCEIIALCEMVIRSNETYFEFFVIPSKLQEQLAETIAMNTCVSSAFDLSSELAEFFVRRQLMLFSKTNHNHKALEPKKRLVRIDIDARTALSNAELLNECVSYAKLVHEMLQQPFERFKLLRDIAQTELVRSESTITKMQFRKWVNSKLAEQPKPYKVANSSDITFCRLLTFLGREHEFSVRGMFRLPLTWNEADAAAATVSSSGTRKRKTVETVLEEYDAYIMRLENEVKRTRREKTEFLDTDNVKQYLRRKRMLAAGEGQPESDAE